MSIVRQLIEIDNRLDGIANNADSDAGFILLYNSTKKFRASVDLLLSDSKRIGKPSINRLFLEALPASEHAPSPKTKRQLKRWAFDVNRLNIEHFVSEPL